NRQLRPFEDECLARGIRYKLIGKCGFWQRPEILDLLAFCRIVEDPLDDVAFSRILLSPYPCSRYLGRATLAVLHRPYLPSLALGFDHKELKSFHRDALCRLHGFLTDLRRTALNSKGTGDVVYNIVDLSDMESYYRAEGGDDGDNFAAENISEAIAAARRFRSLADFIAHAKRAEHAARSGTGLTLSTIHGAKGKEWTTVYVAGCSDGLLPHKRGDWEEERRVFYVACSRAAKRLVLTWHGNPSALIPSISGAKVAFAGTENP
ncbi:MAG: ATP-dependent helicase, partial [Patescibacteria group bacterium]|nr:ATP-dependent helicase [Patescibacteria group bacterium]